jgi:hypothetical protein
MPVIPHTFDFFSSAALLLRRDANAPLPSDDTWEMPLTEALHHVECIGEVVMSDDGRGLLPRPCPLSLLGGEPLAHVSALEALLDRAIASGMGAEVWTTPAWVESYDHVVQLLTPLKPKLNGLLVHTNARMLDRVGIDRMEMLLAGAHAAYVPVSMR